MEEFMPFLWLTCDANSVEADEREA